MRLLVIAVVDDDEMVRTGLERLLRTSGYPVSAFASGEEFLTSGRLQECRCLIADIRMPGMSGLDLQSRLNDDGHPVPIIFITAHGDEKMRIRAMRAGAAAFLAKPFDLLESELFGHEKGAFTGAIAQRVGRFELAHQGTLFLDEVGDIPLALQPKLLRVLQEREFERLGSGQTHKVDVRLIAATHRNLTDLVKQDRFRSDLYYRLHVFPIRIPPLRERREDIPLLVNYFVQRFAKQMGKNIEAIPAAVIKGLTAWDWPGNIRELENFIERAVILTRCRSLEAPLEELHKSNTDQATHGAAEHDTEGLARFLKKAVDALKQNKSVADDYAKKQREEIVTALTESKGRVGGAAGAAVRMGINRNTLVSRMKKFGIYPKQYI